MDITGLLLHMRRIIWKRLGQLPMVDVVEIMMERVTVRLQIRRTDLFGIMRKERAFLTVLMENLPPILNLIFQPLRIISVQTMHRLIKM